MLKIIIPVILLLLFMVTAAITYPRLSVEYGIECKDCHISPSGGGMRTEFGNYTIALQEFCLPQTKEKFVKNYKSPRISKSLLAGFDSRYLVLESGRVFRMQTDIYLNFEPFKDFYYQVRFWENGLTENYAQYYLANKKYYLRAGRFYPAFGLKNADHKSFTRERTGHGSNVYLDGLATGLSINGFNLTAELFDNYDQAVYGLHGFKTGALGSFGYLAGGSLRYSEDVDSLNRGFPYAKAMFGGLSYDRFTLMGEVDLIGRDNDSLATYMNLTTRLEYGLYFITEYNFFDPNRDIKDGVDEFWRLSVELYPIPFFQLRPSMTFYTEGFRKDEEEYFVQIHFGY